MISSNRSSLSFDRSGKVLFLWVLLVLSTVSTKNNFHCNAVQTDNGKIVEGSCLAGEGGSEEGSCTGDDPSLTQQEADDDHDDDDKKEEGKSANCGDSHEKCKYWADFGECQNNPNWMLIHCEESCGVCTPKATMKANYSPRALELGVDMGKAQDFNGEGFGVAKKDIEDLISSARTYMNDEVEGVLDIELMKLCRNEHNLCSIWALLGECDANPNYMKKSCGPVCKSCSFLSVEGRCPIDPDAPEAWGPGDLDVMFRKLSTEPYRSQYDVQILSSPDTTNGPWVLTMENVVREDEAKRLIELGAEEGYERSTDVGDLKADGTVNKIVSTGRTSTNAWCQNDCYADPLAQAVVQRLSNLTGINETNSEYLQLLKYETGQFYNRHHDYIPLEVKRQQGPRILTVYLYLNDVEAGGGTNFPLLDVTVMPKRGRALLWPSVLDHAPSKKDSRTDHQALDVEAGIKYGANAWFHLRDFKTPNGNACQ